jgi:hypothetical protein
MGCMSHLKPQLTRLFCVCIRQAAGQPSPRTLVEYDEFVRVSRLLLRGSPGMVKATVLGVSRVLSLRPSLSSRRLNSYLRKVLHQALVSL